MEREEPLGPGRQRMKQPLRKKKQRRAQELGTTLTSSWSILLAVPLRSPWEPGLFLDKASSRPAVSLPDFGALRPAIDLFPLSQDSSEDSRGEAALPGTLSGSHDFSPYP